MPVYGTVCRREGTHRGQHGLGTRSYTQVVCLGEETHVNTEGNTVWEHAQVSKPCAWEWKVKKNTSLTGLHTRVGYTPCDQAVCAGGRT